MKFYILTLLFINNFAIYGQIDLTNTVAIEKARIEALEVPFIVMTEKCHGYEQTCKMDSAKDEIYFLGETYIIWREGKTFAASKINSCGITKFTIEQDTNNPLVYAMRHFDTIALEEVKQYTLENEGFMIADHSCHYDFIICDGMKKFKKYFDGFDLESSERERNINFNFNNELHLVQLMKNIIALGND